MVFQNDFVQVNILEITYNKVLHSDKVRLLLFCLKKVANYTSSVGEALET